MSIDKGEGLIPRNVPRAAEDDTEGHGIPRGADEAIPKAVPKGPDEFIPRNVPRATGDEDDTEGHSIPRGADEAIPKAVPKGEGQIPRDASEGFVPRGGANRGE